MSPGPWKVALPVVLASVVLAGVLAASADASPEPAAPAPSGPRAPVLVELYTSEGCSSCPSADALLADWAQKGTVEGVPVVVLGFHVDYWNRLGWADPFSRPEWSRRQTDANQALGRDDIFTPQALVNGRVSVVGSDASALRRALGSESVRPAAKVELSARPEGAGVSLSATVSGVPAGVDGAEVWAAVTESGLSVDVKRGENAGRTLRHAPVVRGLVRLGTLPAQGPLTATVPLEAGWKRDRLRAVAFVQERGTRRTLGVAEVVLTAASAR